MAPSLEAIDLEKAKSQQDTAESRDAVAGGAQISSDSIWTLYNTKAEAYDDVLVDRIRASMDSILVFAGLFSAIVTAFILQSYQFLNVDSGDTTVFYLAQISQQLAGLSQGNLTLAPPIGPPTFEPSPSNIAMNVLFAVSLVASLACAFGATLVQAWTTHYLKVVRQSTFPVEKARTRAFYFDGLQRSHMQGFAESIPALLHAALFLFLAGLILFFFPINHVVAYITMGACILCALAYLTFIILHVTIPNSPYQTPLSLVLAATVFYATLSVAVVAAIGLVAVVLLVVSPLVLVVFFLKGKSVRESLRSSNHLREGRETSTLFHKQLQRSRLLGNFQNAPAPNPKRDEKVIKWLLSEIRTVPELEQVVEGIGTLIERQQEESRRAYAGAILQLGSTSVGNFDAGLGLCVGQLLHFCTTTAEPSLDLRRQRMVTATNALVSIFAHSDPTQRTIMTISVRSPSNTLDASCWDLWVNDMTLEALVVLCGDSDPDIQLNAVCLAYVLIHRALTDIATRIERQELSINTPVSWNLRDIVQGLRGKQHRSLPEATAASLLSVSLGVVPDSNEIMAPIVIFDPPDNRSKRTQQRLSLTIGQRSQPQEGGDLQVVPFTAEKLRNQAVLFFPSFLRTVSGNTALATPANMNVLTRTVRAIATNENDGTVASGEMHDLFEATLANLHGSTPSSPISFSDARRGESRVSSVLLDPEVSDMLRNILNPPSFAGPSSQ